MFDLEKEIAAWRSAMASGGVNEPVILDELESHLREYIERQVERGVGQRRAFQAGVERLGKPGVLRREFSRADGMLSWRRLGALLRNRWIPAALSVGVGLAYFCREAMVAPTYQATATIEVQGFPPLSSGDIRAAEAFNTALRLITTNRVNDAVMNSLTPSERRVVFAPADPISKQPTPSAERLLDHLLVRAVRRSYLVLVSARHPDAGAAALVANRYVAEWGNEFGNSGTLKNLSVRVVDPATPPSRPISPNINRLGLAAIACAIATFLGFMLLRALVDKRTGVRWDRGRYVGSS